MTPLPADEAHVHVVRLDDFADGERYLSTEERQRAERFAHEATRLQFIAARANLRLLLSRYLNRSPMNLALAVSSTGKPTLATGEMCFNVSHSEGIAVYAFTARTEVGVDVERVRPYPNHLELAQRFFHPVEFQALARLPEREREEAFFRLWTCKEAFLKATGLGLSGGLERVRLSVHPESPRVITLDEQPVSDWQVTGFELDHGFVAAVVLLATGIKVKRMP